MITLMCRRWSLCGCRQNDQNLSFAPGNKTSWEQKFQSPFVFIDIARIFCLGTLGALCGTKSAESKTSKGRVMERGFSSLRTGVRERVVSSPIGFIQC